MARRVVIAPRAARKLARAQRWLTQPGSGEAGRRRWLDLRDAPDRLGTFPYSGTTDDAHPGQYVLHAGGHRLIYTVDPDTGDVRTAGDIRIVTVFGPGQKGDPS